MSTFGSHLPTNLSQGAMEGPNAPPSDDRFAARLRGFGPVGIVAILLILLTGNIVVTKKMIVLPIGAVLVLLWTWLSRTPWRSIGYSRPKNWLATIAFGVTFGIALKFLMKALVMPLLGADPFNRAYHFLAGNRSMLPSAIWAMLVAGFAEETVVRGYAFERLGKLFGSSLTAKIAIVLLTSTLFGLDHYRVQGAAGAEQAAIVGLIYGTIFAATDRIWVIMFAHAAFDLTALAMIYWNLESRIAHSFSTSMPGPEGIRRLLPVAQRVRTLIASVVSCRRHVPFQRRVPPRFSCELSLWANHGQFGSIRIPSYLPTIRSRLTSSARTILALCFALCFCRRGSSNPWNFMMQFLFVQTGR